MKTIRIGTRGSQLALWQATHVTNRLSEIGVRCERVIVKTTGDKRQDVSLATIGGKGLFIKELEEALVRDEIDIAVHSLKDVPSIIPDEFKLGAYLKRADVRDAWIHPDRAEFASIPEGSKIGTSSPRRRAQLKMLRPDLEVEDIRGNVETRIQKAHAGVVTGVVLASAGLHRLGRESDITSFFSIDQMVPAAGQGIVAIETLKSREDLDDVLAQIADREASVAARCERGVLQQFGTLLDCYSSIAVHAQIDGNEIDLHAFLSDLDGNNCVRIRRDGRVEDEKGLIVAAYEELKARGGVQILEAAARK